MSSVRVHFAAAALACLRLTSGLQKPSYESDSHAGLPKVLTNPNLPDLPRAPWQETSVETYIRNCRLNTRYSHRCVGHDYHTWIANYTERLANWDEHAHHMRLSSKGGLLFLGNSHLGEVYEALVCQLQDQVKMYEATRYDRSKNPRRPVNSQPFPAAENFTDFPLVKRTYGSESSDSVLAEGSNLVYINEVSRTTLSSGARIFAAFNSRQLYEGKKGMDLIAEHLDIDWEKLDGIVLGRFNNIEGWAKFHVLPHAYNGTAHMWEDAKLLKYFQKRGFKGKLALFGMFGDKGPRNITEEIGDTSKFDFEVSALGGKADSLFETACAVGDCDDIPDAHQCIPGVPTQVSAEVSQVMARGKRR